MSNIHVHLPAALLRKPVRTKDDFSEAAHARAANGEVSSGGGGAKKSAADPARAERAKKRLEEAEAGLAKARESGNKTMEAVYTSRAKAERASYEKYKGADESSETKERHDGALNEKETAMANEHVEHREDTPASVFLMPAARKYPVKTKQDGEYKYDRGLLLAAAREARMHGHSALADRADAIREREFGGKE